MEQNQMNNKDLKFAIADSAVTLLIGSNLISQDDLKNLKLEYAYIYKDANGKMVALFKIMCEMKVFYFAVQEDALSLINIDESIYETATKNMKELHECLREVDSGETDAQKERKISNNQFLKEHGISTNENLTCYIDENSVKLKSLDDVCKRAIACIVTVQIACDINNGYYNESLNFFKPFYERFGVQDYLNSKEKRIVDGTYIPQDAIDMDWAYETYWALCWCLGLVDDIKNGGLLCDCQKAMGFIKDLQSFDEFKAKCNMRSAKEILDMHDLYYRYNWAVMNKRINPDTMVGNLNASNVIERRRGLEWVLSGTDDWYELTLNT